MSPLCSNSNIASRKFVLQNETIKTLKILKCLKFIIIIQILSIENLLVTEGEGVSEISAAIDKDFADELFKTCKDLQVPLLGKVVDMFCGDSPGVNTCEMTLRLISKL